ncbi:hypothetical protein DIPPA_09044 [Diplonema papillatum]|nr:hypothetical protein DIPPA_09044 [Diplonema papillatum]
MLETIGCFADSLAARVFPTGGVELAPYPFTLDTCGSTCQKQKTGRFLDKSSRAFLKALVHFLF